MYGTDRSAAAGDGVAVDGNAAGGGKEGDDIGDFGHVDDATDRDIGGQSPLDLFGRHAS